MIDDARLGHLLSILSLSYTDTLIPFVRLGIRDPLTLRRTCLEAMREIDDAYWDPVVRGWWADHAIFAKAFKGLYPRYATASEVAAMRHWVVNGHDGHFAVDLLSYLWVKAVWWIRHQDLTRFELSPEASEIVRVFALSHFSAVNDEEYHDAKDDVRDHVDSDEDLAVKNKFHINFYDGLIDPLLSFDAMRRKHLLLDMSRGRLKDQAFVDAINTVPLLWIEHEGVKSKYQDYRPLIPICGIERLELP